MAVEFVSATASNESAATVNTRTLTQPAGLAVGHWKVASIMTSILTTVSMSAGWKRISRRTSGAASAEVWVKKVTAVPDTDTITPAASCTIAWTLSAWSGCHSIDAVATAFMGNGQSGTTLVYRDTESYAAGSMGLRIGWTTGTEIGIPTETTVAAEGLTTGTQRRTQVAYAAVGDGPIGEISGTMTTGNHFSASLVLHPSGGNAAEVYYILNALRTGSGFQNTSTTPPAEAQTAVGWNYGNNANSIAYALMDAGAEVARSKNIAEEGWTATVLPAANPNNTLGDSIIIGPLNGTYENGRIFVDITGAGNTTASGTHALRARAFKVDTVTGTNPVQIGTGTAESLPIALAGSQINAGLVFIDPDGQITFDNQYLLIQVAWRISVAGTNTGHDFNLRTGTSVVVMPPKVSAAFQQLTKTINFGVGLVPGVIKTAAKSMVYSVSSTRLLEKNTSKSISRNVGVVPTLQKTITSSKIFGISFTPVLNRIRGTALALAFSVTTSRTLGKVTGKTFSRPINVTYSQQKSISHPLTFGILATVSAAASRTFVRALDFAISTSNTLSRAVGKTLSGGITATATASKAASRNLTFIVSISHALQKAPNKVRQFAVGISPSLASTIGRVRELAFNVGIGFSAVKSAARRLAFPVSAAASKHANTGKVLESNANTDASMGNKLVGKHASVGVTVQPSMGTRAIGKAISVPVNIVATLLSGATQIKVLVLEFGVNANTQIRKSVETVKHFATVSQSNETRNIGKRAYFSFGLFSAIRKSLLKEMHLNVNSAQRILKGVNKPIQVDLGVQAFIHKNTRKAAKVAVNATYSIGKAVEKVTNYDIYAVPRYIKQIGTSVTVNINVAVDIVGRLAGVISGPIRITLETVKKPRAMVARMPKAYARLQTTAKAQAFMSVAKKARAVVKVAGKVWATFRQGE